MFRKILTKYLLVWLTLTCMVAFFWPRLPFSAGMLDPFIVSDLFMQGMIAATMLVIGSLLPVEEVHYTIRRWPKVIGGTCVQFLAMPTLAWIAATLFRLDGPYFIGLILVGCVPGAMASNLLTMIGRGNVSYSVGLTTSATLFSPLTVPLLLALFLGNRIPIAFGPMALTLLLTVVCPVLIGFTLSRISDAWRKTADFAGESLGNIVIIWIIASVVASNRTRFDASILGLIPPLIFLNLGGYLAGELGGRILRIDAKMRRALMIEVGMQNAGLGTFLATHYFKDKPQAALCCALYTFGCMFTGILLVQGFRILDWANDRKNPTEQTNEQAAKQAKKQA